MDVRFVSVDKNVLNTVVKLINRRLKLNPHRVLLDPHYKMIISAILRKIYHYAGVNVAVDDYLANENLHSKDPVFFPEITIDIPSHPEALKSLCDGMVDITNKYKVAASNKKALASLLRKIESFVILSATKDL